MKASVITPAYNSAPYLRGLHASLAAQTFEDFEWVVVDDGSDDETATVLRELREDSGLTMSILRHDTSRGAAAARNTGIAAARGEYYKFVDADDFIESGHLAAQVDRMDAHPGAVIASPLQFVAGRGEATTVLPDAGFGMLNFGSGLFADYVKTGAISHCACLFPREAIAETAGYREDLVTDEDGWLLLSMFLSGRRFVPEPGTYYSYRIWHTAQDSSLSNNADLGRLEARERVARMLIEELRARDVDRAVFAASAYKLAMVGFEYGAAYPERARRCLRDALAMGVVLPKGPFSFALAVTKALGYGAGIRAYTGYRWLSRARRELSARLRSPNSRQAVPTPA